MSIDVRVFFLRQPRWPARVAVINDTEADKAVDTLRWRLGLGQQFPHAVLRTLLLPFLRTGWCLAALEHATRWRPNGVRQSPFTITGENGQQVVAAIQFNLESALAKWHGRKPPVEAQSVLDAYRVFHQDRERTAVRHLTDEARRASHTARAAVMRTARAAEQERLSRRRRDRVADCREAERRVRGALGDLARMAGLHEGDGVREITPPNWRNEADRRQQESEQTGAANTGYLAMVDELRLRVAENGVAALTPEARRVLAHRHRGAKAAASIAYLDKLIEETRKTG